MIVRRRGTRTYIVLLLVIVIMALFFVFHSTLQMNFDEIEQNHVQSDLYHLNHLLDDERNRLLRTQNDWSSWDAVYNFVEDGDLQFVDDNITPSVFFDLDLSFMLFFDQAMDLNYWAPSPVLSNGNAFLRELDGTRPSEITDLLVLGSPTAQFAVINGAPVLLAARPILSGNASASPRGTLIWGRVLNDTHFQALSHQLQMEITLFGDAQGAGSTALSDQLPRFDDAITTTDNQIRSRSEIPVLGGSWVIETIQSRVMLNAIRTRVLVGMLILAAAVLVAIAGLFVSFDRALLRRIKNLNDSVTKPPKGALVPLWSAPPSAIMVKEDELGRLTHTLNLMVEDMARSRRDLEVMNTELEQRVAQRTLELATQQTQLLAILDTMGEGLIYNVDGIMVLVNPALAEMVGYDASELVGKPFRTLTPSVDLTMTQNLPRKSDRYETDLVRNDGSLVQVAITATPIRMADNKRRRVIIVRDITQEIAMKRQRDYFFARASHELRTPLTNIMTRLYLLERDAENTPKHLGVLNRVSKHMLTLLNDLLNVARLENGLSLHKQVIALQDVIADVVEVQRSDAEQKQILITSHLSTTPLMAYADPARINQALTNLVRNAIVYTPAEGRIQVHAHLSEDGRNSIISVIDSGIGIASQHLPQLFDPFYRVTEGGSGAGLGLYIVREIMTLHDGKVDVKSTFGIGTTFTLSIALYEAEAILTPT